MQLADRINALATRLGVELRARPNVSHPGLARAWVCFGVVGNQTLIRAAHNVASVFRTATGRYRVSFAFPMPDADYCWTALARSSTNLSNYRLAVLRAFADQKTPQFVDISCATAGGTFDDSPEINLVVYR